MLERHQSELRSEIFNRRQHFILWTSILAIVVARKYTAGYDSDWIICVHSESNEIRGTVDGQSLSASNRPGVGIAVKSK